MNELIAFILTGGALAGAIVYVVKILIAKAIDAGVLNYQLRLDKELEAHKHSLDLIKIQFQIQYSALNHKQGEFIAQLYSSLYDLERDLQHYTTVFQGGEWSQFTERDQKVIDSLKSTRNLFEKNRIYLEDELCNSIENNIKDVEEIIIKMRLAKENAKLLGKDMPNNFLKEGETPAEVWKAQDERARNEITENRKKLAVIFRELLGVKMLS